MAVLSYFTSLGAAEINSETENASNKILIVYCLIQSPDGAYLAFEVADTQPYRRLCPSVHPSVGSFVRNDQVKKWENERS